jgi:hypothetical protein
MGRHPVAVVNLHIAYARTMKVDYSRFSLGGLHGKHVVASSVYSVTIYLHVSGLLVARCQDVTMNLCENWYVMYVLVECRRTWLEFQTGQSTAN